MPLAFYFPETIDVDLKRYPGINTLRAAMAQAEFSDITEHMINFEYALNDIQPYKNKAFSCLHQISEKGFNKGISLMENDLSKGPIRCVSKYVLLWGTK